MMNRMFRKSYDVVVAGAGVAGVAAALAAGRRGRRVALVEKMILPGGLATAGNVLIYLPLSDAHGRQVTFGIAEELLLASLRYGPGVVPDWCGSGKKHRYQVKFIPAAFVLAMDELLDAAGVDLWYDTTLTGAVVDSGRAVGIIVENKSGRGILEAACLVDATGDADVCHHAGAECVENGNHLSAWTLETSLEQAAKAVEGEAVITFKTSGGDADGRGNPDSHRPLFGTSGKDVSEMVVGARRLVLADYKRRQKSLGDDGRRKVFPVSLASMPGFRTTRRIEGLTNIQDGDHLRHFEDSVGVVAHWRGGHRVWELPYSSLLPEGVSGILAAGRCIASAGAEAWDVMRVIPAAAMSGEVAGVAAALSAEAGSTPDRIDLGVLKADLASRGFLFDARPYNSEAPKDFSAPSCHADA